MIVRELSGDRLLLVDQDDHARLAGVLAARYRPRPGDRVVLATGEHDNGWREWDRRPRLDPETGRPHTYRAMPGKPYAALWERGVRRALDLDSSVGLLVSLHGTRFFDAKMEREDDPDPARRPHADEVAFHRAQRRLQAALLKELGHPDDSPDLLPEAVALDLALLRFFDAVSLFLTEQWSSPFESSAPYHGCKFTRIAGARRPEGEGMYEVEEVAVDPFPFEATFGAECPARLVEGSRFPTQDALDRAVGSATPVTLRYTLRPA